MITTIQWVFTRAKHCAVHYVLPHPYYSLTKQELKVEVDPVLLMRKLRFQGVA